MNIIIDVTDLISGIYTNFHMLLCKKCDVGYYVINCGVLKFMITGYCLQFYFHYYTEFLTHPKIKYVELSLILFLMYVKKSPVFVKYYCIKKMHTKENWSFFASRCTNISVST